VKEVISYLLSIAGCGLMLSVFATCANTRKYIEARTMVIHLLRTQPNRAELVCRAQKGTFGEAIAAAMKTAAMLKSNDLNMIVMATKPGYDSAVPMIQQHWKGLMGRGKMAGALTIAGLGLAFSGNGSAILHIILTIIAIAAAIYCLTIKADAERALVHARLEVLPEAERAFAEGRYGFMPTA
jgi:hypothetical protein